jgi:RNA polymerase sigma-70 factor (ECF subfamily)
MADAVALALPGPESGLEDAGNPFAIRPILSSGAAPDMDTSSDRALAERAVRGDAEAFGELYRRYERPIFNFILRSTRQRALAEELLQETFMRVWYAGRTFDPVHGAFRPWLYKIALNAVRSELRKVRYAAEHVPIEDTEAQASGARSPDDPVSRLDLSRQARAVARALHGLPSFLREVVILRCYQQLKFSEIAEITGAPEGTLRARFHRAIGALRESLDGARR